MTENAGVPGDYKDLEWAVELVDKALSGEVVHDPIFTEGVARYAVAALAEPLRQSQQKDNEIAQLARRVVEWDAEEIPRLEKRIEKLEKFIRRRMLDFSKDSHMAQEAAAVLNTEARL